MKVCERCGVSFERPLGTGSALWAARRFCSQPCSLAARTSTPRSCAVDGCLSPGRGAGSYCNLHRQRVRKHGEPNHERWSSAWNRFVDRVEILASDCWLWLGSSTGGGGYGQFWYGGKNGLAHRFGYETMVGPIPVELELDHLCRNRRCVNPTHLEPVTPSENARRGLNSALRPFERRNRRYQQKEI